MTRRRSSASRWSFSGVRTGARCGRGMSSPWRSRAGHRGPPATLTLKLRLLERSAIPVEKSRTAASPLLESAAGLFLEGILDLAPGAPRHACSPALELGGEVAR